MTHSTVSQERENAGSKNVVYHEINITSLDVAGGEGYDPASEVGLEGEDRFGLGIRGQTNSSVAFGYDTSTGNITATNIDDGTDVASGADVGHVTLEVTGN